MDEIPKIRVSSSVMAPNVELKGPRMVWMAVAVKVRPGKKEEFLQTINSLNGDGEKDQGLKSPTLYQGRNDQRSLCLIYQWETQEDLERYLRAEKFRVLLGALKVLCEKSEIRCGNISEKLPDLGCGAFERVSELQTGSE